MDYIKLAAGANVGCGFLTLHSLYRGSSGCTKSIFYHLKNHTLSSEDVFSFAVTKLVSLLDFTGAKERISIRKK